MPNASARLVACEHLDDYVQVARCFEADAADKQVPILGSPGSLAGFPRGIECVDHAAWVSESATPIATATTTTTASDRWCVALDHPVCVALARFLADATGRRLLVFDAEAWERGLDERLASETATSIAFVVPLWRGEQHELDPYWLARILAQVRAREPRLARVGWGIVTGVDPSALSRMVGKAVLQPEIVASYADAPAGMFVSGSAARLDSILPPMLARADEREGSVAPLQVIDDRHIQSGVSLEVCERAWSLLYFRGHGRSYCINDGHLCGARTLATGPSEPASTCVQGMSCANPVDDFYRPGQRAFPRIDPRRYDTSIFLIDSCQAGGWASSHWKSGTPAVAIHAAAGAASAVMASDYSTMSSVSAHTELFQVLWSASTLGEAIARLNRARPSTIAEFPYYLLGDPECPVGRSRWPRWCSEPLAQRRERTPRCQTIVAACSLDAPYTRVALELRGAEHTTSYLRTDDPDAQLHAVHLLADDEPELWFCVERRAGAGPVEVVVETYPTPRLPAGLLDAALATPLLLRSWSELLQAAAPASALAAAAEQLEAAHELGRRLRGRATTIDPGEPQSCVASARQAWLAAHLAAIEYASTLTEGGLWPLRLWRGVQHRGVSSLDACPYCGAAPTVHRRYQSPPTLQRLQWECVACALISDRPLVPMPAVAIDMPDRIAAGQTIVASLELASGESDPHFAIAGVLLIDRKGHQVAPPPAFAFELPPGARHSLSVELSSMRAPDIHHRYYARALLLINGAWLMTARIVTVGP
ncbi:hypothetical protein ACNOYE_12855 [Nannocystaceae bacterium ST9]